MSPDLHDTYQIPSFHFLFQFSHLSSSDTLTFSTRSIFGEFGMRKRGGLDKVLVKGSCPSDNSISGDDSKSAKEDERTDP